MRARRAARRTTRPIGLSREAICAAALELIDREGLAAFSTRKLGRALRCEAMAIYWYFPSKDALLDAVVDSLMAGVGDAVAKAGPAEWIDALREVARAYRRLARDHPRAFPLLTTRRFASEGTFAFLERLFELASRQGIGERDAARFYRVVSSYCNGFALSELAAERAPNDPSLAALRARYPRVASVWKWLEPRHMGGIFEFGLDLQLSALAARTARRGEWGESEIHDAREPRVTGAPRVRSARNSD